nr:immunoglobulin heavy chain junction region [Macaca mulatta]MOW20025.1 immunoglobulin heavy chain junction region [Macaca mulatta]MOW20104.1 immunoglobulin heavy chain junction region [Macaca mulatta]MOW20258.1 immunoglobulin heavy chain junction region [Macaca mulatta]MOW20417.1 immunoglobulin heavy chain junction region [Macaca mulatta]
CARDGEYCNGNHCYAPGSLYHW